MADNSKTGSAAVDVIGVFKSSDLTQVFAKARPLQATVNEGGELMKHPLEDGSKITDHLVKRLTEITLPLMLTGDFKPVLDEIRQIYEAGTVLTVQTRSGAYKSMAIYDFPHDETAEAMDAITVTLKLGEARFIKATLGGPVTSASKPKQAATTKRGQVQPKATATTPQASHALKIYRHITVK